MGSLMEPKGKSQVTIFSLCLCPSPFLLGTLLLYLSFFLQGSVMFPCA